jgi:hypothetical protein
MEQGVIIQNLIQGGGRMGLRADLASSSSSK